VSVDETMNYCKGEGEKKEGESGEKKIEGGKR